MKRKEKNQEKPIQEQKYNTTKKNSGMQQQLN